MVVVKRRIQQHTHPPIKNPPTCTHPPTMQGSFADAHLLAVTTILRIMNGKATHPVTTHSPTNNPYPPTHTHAATIGGFRADTHRLTVKAILKLMLEHIKKRTVNEVA